MDSDGIHGWWFCGRPCMFCISFLDPAQCLIQIYNANRSEVSVPFYCHLSSIIISYTWLIIWCCSGSFLWQLQAGPPLDEMSIACILRDLLHAIEYLHSEGKIHRDIKGLLPPFPFLTWMFLLNTCNYLEQLPTNSNRPLQATSILWGCKLEWVFHQAVFTLSGNGQYFQIDLPHWLVYLIYLDKSFPVGLVISLLVRYTSLSWK